jgi:CheY-like chemotaxis protein
VRKAAGKAASLTRQLLAFGRKGAVARQVASVRHTLADIANLMTPLLGANYALEVAMPEPDLRVETGAGQLEQALVNLLINGRDAMPAGGELRVAAEARAIDEAEARHHHGARPGRYAVISVEDKGTGIDPAVMPRIFEPFFTTKDPGRGTGLGLAMVYGLVHSSDGFVSVASEPGRGSIFSIHLPLVHAPVSAVVEKLDRSFKGRGETVLVVEDNDAVRNLAQDCLVEAGYKVLVAANGLEAIEIDEEHEGAIDLLLSDVVMPVLGGVETAISLKAHRPGIAVLLMTGYPSRGQAKSVEIPREFCVLEKPFDPDVLLKTVRQVITRAANQASVA